MGKDGSKPSCRLKISLTFAREAMSTLLRAVTRSKYCRWNYQAPPIKNQALLRKGKKIVISGTGSRGDFAVFVVRHGCLRCVQPDRHRRLKQGTQR
jgi:hypothetical protein